MHSEETRTGLAPTLAVLVFCLPIWAGCDRARAQDRAALPQVSMIQLIATPERYQKKRVQVIGFLRLEFEGDALYLHREDYRNRITSNGLWVDVPDSARRNSKKLSDRYVIVEGIFDSSERGHMGLFSGTLSGINRLEALPW